MIVLLNGKPYPGPTDPGNLLRLEFQFLPGELGSGQTNTETYDAYIVLQKLGAMCVEARNATGHRVSKLYGAVVVDRRPLQGE